ncbi:hypothetical protein [Halobaculum sp. D14]|uniref:hypothetical protein n=1 Tax=unclassified Halobaculum TaxID=2640896 RepID=UPI003EC04D75
MLPSDSIDRADALLTVIPAAFVVAAAVTAATALPFVAAAVLGSTVAGAAMVDGLLVNPPTSE